MPITRWQLLGQRAPALSETKNPQWGTPVNLFNGKDLAGWRLSDPSKKSWEVVDGTLVSNGHGSELISIPKFFDFKLHLEFNAGHNSNSGVFLRGRYEVQIETESAAEPPSHHTGGVYGFLDPIPEQPRKADEWQSFDITLVGRTVTVVQNGVTVIDHKEIAGITGGALDSNEGLPGPHLPPRHRSGTGRFSQHRDHACAEVDCAQWSDGSSPVGIYLRSKFTQD